MTHSSDTEPDAKNRLVLQTYQESYMFLPDIDRPYPGEREVERARGLIPEDTSPTTTKTIKSASRSPD